MSYPNAVGAAGVTRHVLESWLPYFEHTRSGAKSFDVRIADRAFAVGDEVELVEWSPVGDLATGRRCVRRIVYILDGADADAIGFGLRHGHVVLGLAPVADDA